MVLVRRRLGVRSCPGAPGARSPARARVVAGPPARTPNAGEATPMSTSLLVALCLSPFLAIFVLGLVAQGRKERRAMSDFAALLDGGTVSRRRATGRWKGV